MHRPDARLAALLTGDQRSLRHAARAAAGRRQFRAGAESDGGLLVGMRVRPFSVLALLTGLLADKL